MVLNDKLWISLRGGDAGLKCDAFQAGRRWQWRRWNQADAGLRRVFNDVERKKKSKKKRLGPCDLSVCTECGKVGGWGGSNIFLCWRKVSKLSKNKNFPTWLAATSTCGTVYQRKRCIHRLWQSPFPLPPPPPHSSLGTANTNLAIANDFWRLIKHLRGPPVMDSSCRSTENYYHLFKKIALEAAISEGDIG